VNNPLYKLALNTVNIVVEYRWNLWKDHLRHLTFKNHASYI